MRMSRHPILTSAKQAARAVPPAPTTRPAAGIKELAPGAESANTEGRYAGPFPLFGDIPRPIVTFIFVLVGDREDDTLLAADDDSFSLSTF